MTAPSRTDLVERAALHSACFYAAILPFWGWTAPPWRVSGIWWGDWVAGACAPLWLVLAWQQRTRLVRSRLLWGVAVVGLAPLVVAPFQHGLPSMAQLAKSPHFGAFTLGIAAVALRFGTATLCRALCGGGILAVGIALGGYVAFVQGVAPGNMFARQFDGGLVAPWPRLTGTFFPSPQHMAEYLCVLCAAALYLWQRDRQWWTRALAVAAGATSVLTFSYGWVAVGVVWAAALRTRHRPLGFALMLGLWFSLSWVMAFDLPGSAAPPVDQPCANLDLEHRVARRDGDSCIPLSRDRPYLAALTTYRASKEFAWQRYRTAPIVGSGAEDYAHRAFARFEAGLSLGYLTPHSTYLGALVEAGLVGGAALLVLVVLGARCRPADGIPERMLWFALLGFAMLGLHIDVLRQRHVWFLLSLLIAWQVRDRESNASHTQRN